jgi:hypothetical protein
MRSPSGEMVCIYGKHDLVLVFKVGLKFAEMPGVAETFWNQLVSRVT